eukprot:1145681-Pelagomonas_calceolata.AAC.3
MAKSTKTWKGTGTRSLQLWLQSVQHFVSVLAAPTLAMSSAHVIGVDRALDATHIPLHLTPQEELARKGKGRGRRGKERKGKGRKGEERKGKERKGKERKGRRKEGERKGKGKERRG